MELHRTAFALLLLGAAARAAGPLPDGQVAGGTGLERARKTFAAADKNGDGRIERAELELARVKVGGDEFAARDLDGDKLWSRDEFVLWYRGLLIAGRQRPAADLDAEAARILAQQRSRATTATVIETGEDARLARAIEELERKALARGATREDFTQVRTMWEQRLAATEPNLPAAEAASLKQKVGRAMADLEQRAAAGGATREEFSQLRRALLARARAANGTTAPTAEDAGLEARFAQALDELEAQALARAATREQFAAVREQLAARARRAAAAEGVAGAEADLRTAELARQLEAALNRLEERALAGQATREEFLELRGMFVARARRAVNGGTTAATVEAAPAAPRRAEATPVPTGETPNTRGAQPSATDVPPAAPSESRTGRREALPAPAAPSVPPAAGRGATPVPPARGTDAKPAEPKPAQPKPTEARPAPKPTGR